MTQRSDKNVFFAASNTSEGFISYFKEIFSPLSLDKIYIIKGGPGTGKSYFMKQVGKEAEKRGIKTEYFLCSSDTNSLDGVLFPDMKTAVIDGTAPHLTDPIYPGAVEVILNFGDFFDTESLTSHRDEIRKIVSEKSVCYQKGYEYLSCVGTLSQVYDSYVSEAVNTQKMMLVVQRELLNLTKKGEKKTRNLNSIGVHGEITLDTFARMAKKTVYIKEFFNTSYSFLGMLEKMLTERGLSFYVSRDVLCPKKADGIYIPENETAYVISKEDKPEGKNINMQRFVDRKKLRPHLSKLRFVAKTSAGVKAESLRCFAQAGALHAKLEEMYISSMNFESKEKFSMEFIKRLFS